jgi:hypothetical protein
MDPPVPEGWIRFVLASGLVNAETTKQNVIMHGLQFRIPLETGN